MYPILVPSCSFHRFIPQASAESKGELLNGVTLEWVRTQGVFSPAAIEGEADEEQI
jgi:hypothetical protein